MPGTTGFYEIYRDAPVERREWLRSFRLRHPYQHFTWHGTEWEYIASDALGDAPRATEHWALKHNHTSKQEGDAVLVLGGATSTAESSFDIIAALERHHRILSPSYPPVESVGVLVEGLVALLDALGLERVHVVGHSLGAGIGHVLVRRYPDRVDKLVLSSFGLYTDKRARRIKLALRLLRMLPYSLVKRYYLRRLSRSLDASAAKEGNGIRLPASERAFLTAYLTDLMEYQHSGPSLKGHLALVMDLIENADVYGVNDPVKRPDDVLIIQAEDDRGFEPEEQAALQETYPGARVETFEHGGHNVRRVNPTAYDEVLSDFLGSDTSSTGDAQS